MAASPFHYEPEDRMGIEEGLLFFGKSSPRLPFGREVCRFLGYILKIPNDPIAFKLLSFLAADSVEAIIDLLNKGRISFF